MKFFRCVFLGLFAVSLAFSPLHAQDLELTSDKMRYDSESGDFWAEKNVKVTRGTLIATSEIADGNVNAQKFSMKGKVHVFGSWEKDKVDMTGDSLSGVFSEPREYVFEGKVKGYWGPREVDVDILRMKGDRFWGSPVRKYADKNEGYVLVCDSVEGKLANGVIDEFIADGNVVFRSSPKKGEPTEIRGAKAVYSKARGTLVVTGKVTAIQPSRTLNADTLIFFPEKNRVEATGKPRLIFKMDEGGKKK
jgi:lipopolysaccharide export system protein LptA